MILCEKARNGEEKLFSIIDGRYRKEAPSYIQVTYNPKALQIKSKRSYDRIVETN